MGKRLYGEYDPVRFDREFAERRGVPTSQTRREFAALWADVDQKYNSTGLITPVGPLLRNPELPPLPEILID